ncbi:MAG TPA: tRNA (adenosine(37)-N6)-dimethylallyltransferase MiaA [Chromatiaceae bacterium]|nr:tRNA (adenosine(37)-N6)-dimethylallyltransferase MiaA [Chromatiaceae bacterium]
MGSKSPPAIFLMGPTASGKTDLAVELLQRFPCDIISVDSALVYRDMNIGTAKPDAALLARAPHRLIDIRDPSDPYSAADFHDDAIQEMAEIHARGRVPLLVGGTMLYYRALERGLADMPAADQRVRERLSAEAEQSGWPAMHERLRQIDPPAADRIEPTDPQRIQRALEVYELTGTSMTDLHARPSTGHDFPWRVLKLAIAPGDRSVLHERIERRFRLMLEAGFIAEVEGLRARPELHPDLPSMRAVGYRQIWSHLDGEYDHETMIERGIIATRQLAKRQLTWLRGEAEACWFDSTEDSAVDRVVEAVTGHLDG